MQACENPLVPALLATAAALLSSPLASAQSFELVLETGHVSPYGGTVVGITDFYPSSLARVEMQDPDPTRDWALLSGGYSYFLVGGKPNAYGIPRVLARLGSGIHGIVEHDEFDAYYSLAGGFDYYGRTGDPVVGLASLAGSRWTDFADMQEVEDSGSVYTLLFLRGSVQEWPHPPRRVLTRSRRIPAVTEHVLLAEEGQALGSSGLVLTELFTHPEGAVVRRKEQWMLSGLFEPVPGQPESLITYKKDPVIREGLPAPLASRTYGHDREPALAVGLLGQWLVRTVLDDGRALLVRNGDLVVHEGQSPEAIAPRVVTRIGKERPLVFGFAGAAVWYGTIDDGSEALFLEHTPVLEVGKTRIWGRRVVGFGPEPRILKQDADDVYVRVVLEDARAVVVKFDLRMGEKIDTPPTDAPPLVLHGFERSDRNVAQVTAWNLPPGEPFTLLASPVAGSIPYANSTLVVAGAPHRIHSVSSQAGRVSMGLDLEALEAAGVLQPGQTTYFQGWYRDSSDPVHPGKLTDGWQVTFH